MERRGRDHHSGEKREGPPQWREEGGTTTVERRGRDHHSGEKREGPPQWREEGGTTTVHGEKMEGPPQWREVGGSGVGGEGESVEKEGVGVTRARREEQRSG